MPVFTHMDVISNSCFEVVCRMFYDCINRVVLVTLVASVRSSCCCKVLEYDLRVSQGSAVTVEWRGVKKFKKNI